MRDLCNNNFSSGDPLVLAKALIEYPSISPNDAGCQTFLAEWFKARGFSVECMPSGRVQNLWVYQKPTLGPTLMFAGHTDVVPAGDLTQWISQPFAPTVRDGFLFGRGACDMKGGLAAMLAAVDTVIQKKVCLKGNIAFLITSGEEGQDYRDGTPFVMDKLKLRHEIPKYCIVGEPSCESQIGDTIKVGRRGSLSGNLVVRGKPGHVAYPHQVQNPVSLITPILSTLNQTQWDKGCDSFPPTSFQITRLHADSGSNNVVPGEMEMRFNFRYSPAVTADVLKEKVTAIIQNYVSDYTLSWTLSGEPFFTPQGKLLEVVQHAIQTQCNITPILSTSGGTSDGRFIAPFGVEVLELGLVNKTIHQINESTRVTDLYVLAEIYEKIIENLLG